MDAKTEAKPRPPQQPGDVIDGLLFPFAEFPALGEAIEAYDVELRDGADVLVESDTVTDPSYALVYGGSLTGYSFTVWMKSATVGRGYPATLEF